MRKNCMAEVAKALGLELEEVFRIDGDEHYFRLTDTGLGMSIGSDNKNWFVAPINALYGLLLGENEIIKLPWKPEKNEAYYFPCPDSDQLWGCDKWEDCDDDYHRLKHGLVLESIGEAVEVANQMLVAVKEYREQ